MSQIVLELTEEEARLLNERAQEQGFTPEAFLRVILRERIEEDSIDHIRANIKQGLKEAFRGETVPLETLWTDDDDE